MSFVLLNNSLKHFDKRLLMTILFLMVKTPKYLCFGTFLLILTLGCGIKREQPDDVKLIKSVVGRFQIAVNSRYRLALDSLYVKDQLSQEYRIPKLLQDLSDLGDLRDIRFTAKRFEIFKDSAAVLCTLLAEDVKPSSKKVIKRPFEIHLWKEKKEWKIMGHKLK